MNNRHITEKEKEEIRRLYTTTALSQTQIAKRFRLSTNTISRVVRSTNIGLAPRNRP